MESTTTTSPSSPRCRDALGYSGRMALRGRGGASMRAWIGAGAGGGGGCAGGGSAGGGSAAWRFDAGASGMFSASRSGSLEVWGGGGGGGGGCAGWKFDAGASGMFGGCAAGMFGGCAAGMFDAGASWMFSASRSGGLEVWGGSGGGVAGGAGESSSANENSMAETSIDGGVNRAAQLASVMSARAKSRCSASDAASANSLPFISSSARSGFLLPTIINDGGHWLVHQAY